MPCGASTSIQIRVYHGVSDGFKLLILLAPPYRRVSPFVRQWLRFGYIVLCAFGVRERPDLVVAKNFSALAVFSTRSAIKRFSLENG